MIKLRDILKEIGETTEPYPFTVSYSGIRGQSAICEYTFENKNQDTIEVSIFVRLKQIVHIDGTQHEGPQLEVTFALKDAVDDEDDEDKKYKDMTGSGDALKVISTVVACIKDTAEKVLDSLDEVLTITFIGDDSKRFNVYLKYAQKQLPAGWVIKTDEGDGRITLFNTNIQ